jgi:L-threonylcarbamoyladenylate synthase
MIKDLKAAVEILHRGGLVLYPTDTIWGIGCDATNEEAVARIYSIKKREDEKSLLILLDDAEKLTEYVTEVPEIAWNLIDLSDKPLTIIYSGARNLARNLIARDGTIGIRIVKDDFCRQMISRFGKPVVSTSANVSGMPWPPYFQKIDRTIIKSMDYIVTYRQNEKLRGKPSGIIKVGKNGEIRVIRE